MSRLFRLLLLGIGLLAFGFFLYVVKLGHNLDVNLRGDLNRRFTAATAQVTVLDEGAEHRRLTEHERALVGQTVVAEFLMSARVTGYQAQHGTLPTSIEELDSSRPGKQPSPRDPWGNPFRLMAEDKDRFMIVSGGPSGDMLLGEEERATLRKQPVGRVYQLHGKIVLNWGLLGARD